MQGQDKRLTQRWFAIPPLLASAWYAKIPWFFGAWLIKHGCAGLVGLKKHKFDAGLANQRLQAILHEIPQGCTGQTGPGYRQFFSESNCNHANENLGPWPSSIWQSLLVALAKSNQSPKSMTKNTHQPKQLEWTTTWHLLNQSEEFTAQFPRLFWSLPCHLRHSKVTGISDAAEEQSRHTFNNYFTMLKIC